MPRVAGQIDVAKTEAILDAAVEVIGQRGLGAPMEAIARRAGVSKQTVYNHYGSKTELVRALAARRAHEVTAPLDTAESLDQPVETLTAFARVLLTAVLNPAGVSFYRMAVANAHALPDIGRAMFEAGALTSRRRLAAYLAQETAAGRLACPDPMRAAEFFAGGVIGSAQTAMLLGVETRHAPEEIDQSAREAAERFVRAYAA